MRNHHFFIGGYLLINNIVFSSFFLKIIVIVAGRASSQGQPLQNPAVEAHGNSPHQRDRSPASHQRDAGDKSPGFHQRDKFPSNLSSQGVGRTPPRSPKHRDTSPDSGHAREIQVNSKGWHTCTCWKYRTVLLFTTLLLNQKS